MSDKLKSRYEGAEAALRKIRDDSAFPWTDREALFLGINRDKASEEARSNVNTQDLQNLVIDGASRVMAQLPTGRSQVMTRADRGKNQLMNLLLEKHIFENTHSVQHPWKVKLRMWDMYSRIYGAMPMLAVWRVDDEYTGPDAYLINPRHCRFQPGKTTVQECDYVFVDSWVSVSWLEGRDKKIWKNIPELLRRAKDDRDSKQGADERDLTYIEQQSRDGFVGEEGKFGQILLVTQYEKDKWTTFSPKYDITVREIKNPNNDNRIPIVMKQCYPLMDRIYGLGEFERGRTLQYAVNSLVNLYMDGVKMSIFPPVILTGQNAVPASIKYEPFAKWVETQPNSIRRHEVSPGGLNTFERTYAFLKSALLNMGATTDTSVSTNTDPGQGKTPQALKMQENREGARDAWDRHMMESAYEELCNIFVNMFGAQQEKPIRLDIFKKEIETLQGLYEGENILEVFTSGEYGQLTAQPDAFKFGEEPIPVKYYVDAGSSSKKDDKTENENLGAIMALVMKNPQIMEALQAKGLQLDMAELFKRFFISSGVQDWDKILIEQNNPTGNPGLGAETATMPTPPQDVPMGFPNDQIL